MTNARVKSKLITEADCPACGERIYFYEIGTIHCACGGCALTLEVTVMIIDRENEEDEQ